LTCSGRLSGPVDRPASIRRPDFVAITTWSRTGARASPANSSLAKGAVDLGGVREADAAVERGADHADHVVSVAGVGAVALGHAHAAQAPIAETSRPWPSVRMCTV
jgi:hypothetical protein